MKKMTKNKMVNLMIVIFQLTEMKWIIFCLVVVMLCNVFRQLSTSCLMQFACYIIKKNTLMPS